ncbi:MAG: hypothetical protein WAU36_03310 [Cyclobacteriaceae bacterium]
MRFSIHSGIYPYFVLIGLFSVSCSNDDDINPSNTIDIPDAHFETQLIELGIDSDGIVNQRILKTDAEAATLLDLNHSSHFGEISDLTGIEGFRNITFLSAVGQEIEQVDLSANTQLDTLFLSANYLTTIDLSNNPNLVFLDLQVNELSSINGLSEATHLRDVNLSWNNFETISIQNEAIEVLYITHNLLKSIDTDGASNLKNVLMISNQLTSVDFSSNTMLETLVISGNQLQDINLAQNSSLTHLYISSNLLTSLDVSNNQALIDLRVDRNQNLNCIKVLDDQEIPTVSLSDHQQLNDICS